MNLADIKTSEENNNIRNELISSKYNETGSSNQNRWWIGATDLGSEGIFYWINSGEELKFNDFPNHNTDNVNDNEHCVEIIDQWDYKWNDLTCDSRLYFICKEIMQNEQYELMYVRNSVN